MCRSPLLTSTCLLAFYWLAFLLALFTCSNPFQSFSIFIQRAPVFVLRSTCINAVRPQCLQWRQVLFERVCSMCTRKAFLCVKSKGSKPHGTASCRERGVSSAAQKSRMDPPTTGASCIAYGLWTARCLKCPVLVHLRKASSISLACYYITSTRGARSCGGISSKMQTGQHSHTDGCRYERGDALQYMWQATQVKRKKTGLRRDPIYTHRPGFCQVRARAEDGLRNMKHIRQGQPPHIEYWHMDGGTL